MADNWATVIDMFMSYEARNLGAVESAELIHQYPAILSYRDSFGWTPMMMAALYVNVELMEVLIFNGADVDAVSYSGQDDPYDFAKGINALMILANAGGSRWRIWLAMEMLLRQGANANIKNCRGEKASDLCRYWLTYGRELLSATDEDLDCYRGMVNLLEKYEKKYKYNRTK